MTRLTTQVNELQYAADAALPRAPMGHPFPHAAALREREAAEAAIRAEAAMRAAAPLPSSGSGEDPWQ
eukprot:8675465-Heterocapsa_arctica.AAC.1